VFEEKVTLHLDIRKEYDIELTVLSPALAPEFENSQGRMPTLFLSAPKIRTQHGSGFYRTFDTILSNGVGPDYGIYSNLVGQVHSGMRVVVSTEMCSAAQRV
jgi:hypothetical protein